MLSKDKKREIEDNNRRISELLRDNETILREAGYEPPVTDYPIDPRARINFPSGYIRTNDFFILKYRLNTLCASAAVRKNIAYSLQLSDLFSYLLNRFYIWGSIGSMLLKLAIINNASILEALILESANRICDHPSSCGKTDTCSRHMNQKERNYVLHALAKLRERRIIELDELESELFGQIVDRRNNVHIRLADENEFSSGKYSLEIYNKSMLLIRKINNQLFENASREFCLEV